MTLSTEGLSYPGKLQDFALYPLRLPMDLRKSTPNCKELPGSSVDNNATDYENKLGIFV